MLSHIKQNVGKQKNLSIFVNIEKVNYQIKVNRSLCHRLLDIFHKLSVPVVDVYFEGKGIDTDLLLPSIHDALTIKRNDGRILVVEVQTTHW